MISIFFCFVSSSSSVGLQTDKASMLAEVIEHVKELKRQTSAVLGAAGEGDGGEEAAARQYLLLRSLLPGEIDRAAARARQARTLVSELIQGEPPKTKSGRGRPPPRMQRLHPRARFL